MKKFIDFYREAVTQKSGGGGGGSATLIDKNISANGTYNASDDNADGYKKAVVNVPNDFLPDPTVYTKTVQDCYARQHANGIDNAYAGQTNWYCTVLKTEGVAVGDKIIVIGDDLGTGPLHYAVWGTVTSVASRDSTKDTVRLTVAGSTFKNNQKYTMIQQVGNGESYTLDVSTINQITVTGTDLPGMLLCDYLNLACDSSFSLFVTEPNVEALPMMAFCGIPNLDVVELPNCGGQIAGCFAYSSASHNANGMTITIGNPDGFYTFVDSYGSTPIELPCFTGCGGVLALLLPNVESVPTIEYESARALDTALQLSSGSIYVPDSLVTDFEVDSNWSMLSPYITAISNYQPS